MTWEAELDAPKFWDDKRQEVIEGVEVRKTPTQLADILGTYVWVYSGDPEFGGDVEEMHRSYYKNDKDFIAKKSITLGDAKHPPSQPVELKDVNGHIAWGTAKIIFNGVRRLREKRSSNPAVPWLESYW